MRERELTTPGDVATVAVWSAACWVLWALPGRRDGLLAMALFFGGSAVCMWLANRRRWHLAAMRGRVVESPLRALD